MFVDLQLVLIHDTNVIICFSFATLTGLNPLKNSLTLNPIVCLFNPEVWQQSVEAGVHRGSPRSIGGVGLQGEVQQEARDRGLSAPRLV